MNSQSVNRVLICITALYVLAVSLFWILLASHTNQSAWDSLTFWFPRAIEFLDENAVVWVRGEDPSQMQAMHPSLVPTMLALAVRLSNLLSAPIGLLLLIAYMVAMAVLVVTAHRASGSRFRSGIPFLFIIIALPLVENHVLRIGYADLWLALGYLASAVGFGGYLERSNFTSLMLGIFGVSLCLTAKDTGVIYALLSALLFLATLAFRVFSPAALATALSLGALILFAALFNPQQIFDVTGHMVGFKLDDYGRLLIQGGRQTELIELKPLYPIVLAELGRWFTNSSFSVLATTFLLSSPIFLGSRISAGRPKDRLLYVWACAVSLWIFILSIQVLTTKYFLLGTNADTSISRFLIPVALTMVLYISHIVVAISSKRIEGSGEW